MSGGNEKGPNITYNNIRKACPLAYVQMGIINGNKIFVTVFLSLNIANIELHSQI